MFAVGEKVNYTRFVWSSESDETDVVTIIKIIDEDTVYIANSSGTQKRSVKMNELSKIDKERPTPFGSII
jgi:hypothetical protein